MADTKGSKGTDATANGSLKDGKDKPVTHGAPSNAGTGKSKK